MTIAATLHSREAPQLELLRVALGLALLASYAPLTGDLAALYGDDGWVSREAFGTASLDAGWYSVFAWVRGPITRATVHVTFLAAALAFTLGWGVRWVKWPIWIVYISYLNRNPAIVYGADLLMANLLLVVCIAPVGRGLAIGATGGAWPSGPRAVVCLSLVRWQMAVVFLFTAVQKLRGELWWSGEAVWVVVTNLEFAQPGLSDVLAHQVWVVNLATHATLGLELAYPFLVWDRRTRPWILGAAILFHLATAVLFGLYLFAGVAIAGHLSFAPAGVSKARPCFGPDRSMPLSVPAQCRACYTHTRIART
jgi:hypothetical protein